jgi:uncharacterized protein with GYD domain
MSLVLNVEILGEFKKLTAATAGAQTDLQKMSKRADSASKAISRSFAAIGVGLSFRFIANELEEATKAAVADTKSQELLANQLVNTTGATDDQIKAVEKSIKTMMLQSSIADDDLRPAFAQLTRATGSTSEATKLLTLATDISAQTGKDLTTVSLGLSKAYNGQFGALSKLGIPMTDSIQNAQMYSVEMKKLNKLQTDSNYFLDTYGIKSKEYISAQEKVVSQQEKVNTIAQEGIDWQGQLGKAFEGAAEKAANADPYQRMKIIFDELQETIGMALLPSLEKFASFIASPAGQEKLQKFIDLVTGLASKFEILATFAIDNADAVIAWSGVLLGLGVTIKLLTVTLGIYNGVAAIMAARNAAAAASAAAVGVAAAGAVPGLTAMNVSAGALLGTLGLLTAGAIGAAFGGFQQGKQTGQNAVLMGAKEVPGDPFSAFKKIPAVLGGKSTPSTSVTNNVTINTPRVDAQGIVNTLNTATRNGYTGTLRSLKE